MLVERQSVRARRSDRRILGILDHTASMGQNEPVIGPIIIVVVLVVAIPVAVCMSGAIVAWILGWFMKDDAEKRNAGTEYVELGG